jgi:hypothetical protein
MYAPPQIVEAAKRNGRDNIYGQFQVRLNDRIRADRVVDLLVNATSPAAQRGARELLHQMGRGGWDVIAPVHSNLGDPTPHIRLSVCKTQYHVRLDARGCIFDITFLDEAGKTSRLSGYEPWARPGAIG